MTNHVFGEGYKDIQDRTEEEIDNILFMHSPIHDTAFDNISNMKLYVQYMQKTKNMSK